MLYLLCATFCYYVLYATAVKCNFRLKVPYDENVNSWQNFTAHNKGILELLVLDFLKVHCPWSKRVSIRYRVQETRLLLQRMTHEKGWTIADCDNPAKHQQIAKDCFEPRITFWTRGILRLLIAPLSIVILLLIFFVILPFIDILCLIKK